MAFGFSPGNFNEIKSHSSYLNNINISELFQTLNYYSYQVQYDITNLKNIRAVYGALKTIWTNIRTLVRNNPNCRRILKLETHTPGVYTIDVELGLIKYQLALSYTNNANYTLKELLDIVDRLDIVNMVIRDVLQFFNFFYRPDYKQKPDIQLQAEEYKDRGSRLTTQELELLAGIHNNKLEDLGAPAEESKKLPPTDDEDEVDYD